MKIKDHRLCSDDDQPVPFQKSPNVGRKMTPEYLVVHYTGGETASSAVQWLTSPRSKVAAHLVIDRAGGVTQLVPFDTQAWHAGDSQWDGRKDMNLYSIGVELDNPGRLIRQKDTWVAPFGKPYPAGEVIEAVHKYGRESFGWHVYAPAQIDALLAVAVALYEQYGLVGVTGHDDIAPRRKWDPGPAFPWDDFRARLDAALQSPERPWLATPVYETTVAYPLRCGPGKEFKTIPGARLPQAVPLQRLSYDGVWWLVRAVSVADGATALQGWMPGNYARRSMRFVS